MKFIISVLIFFFTFVILYLLFSICGLLWCSYKEVICNEDWAIIYCVFFGWISLIPAVEFYEEY